MKTKISFADAALENEAEHLLEKTAEHAKVAAESLHPGSKEEVRFGFKAIHHRYQGIINLIVTRLNLHTAASEATRLRAEQQATEAAQVQAITAAKEQLIDLPQVLKYRNLSPMQRRLLQGLTVLLLLAEGLFLMPAFAYLRMPFYTAVVVSLTLSGVLSLFAHISPRYIDTGRFPKSLSLRLVIALVPIMILMRLLAHVRVYMNPENTSTVSPTIQILVYTIVSILLYGGAVLIAIWLYKDKQQAPSPEDMQRAAARAACEQTIREGEQRIQASREELDRQLSELYARYQYGCTLIQQIRNTAAQVFDHYCTILHRKNSGTDVSIFFFDAYPFSFDLAIETYPQQEQKPQKILGSAFQTIVLALGLAALLWGCTPQKDDADSVAVTSIVDITDEVVCPDTAALFAMMGLQEHPWREYTFSATHITHVDFPATRVAELESESRYTGNQYERQKRIQDFKVSVASGCNNLYDVDTTGSLSHSIVYRTIARELNNLAELSAERKLCVIHSNLMENDEVNLYTKKDWELLVRKPERLRELFLKQVPLEPLSRIEVIFVYAPKDHADNTRYQTIARFFSDFFSEHGAETSIHSKL